MIWNVQLVFDSTDPNDIMLFWGKALAYPGEFFDDAMTMEKLLDWRKGFPQYDGRGRIDDSEGRRVPVYIQTVPEPKTQSNRVRLDVIGDPQRFTSLGATQQQDHWLDIEGNEFTLEPGDVPRIRTIVFDAVDPDAQLVFWSNLTGYRYEDGDLVRESDTPDPLQRRLDLAPALSFTKASEPKTLKNRLHIDLASNDLDNDLDLALSLGATVQRWDTDQVLLDPEGNEFCLNDPSQHQGQA